MVKFRGKLRSVLALAMAVVVLATMAVPTFAAGTASVGSVAGDINGGTIIGQDVDQGKQTEYWPENEVSDDTLISGVDVYATIPDSGIVVTVPKVIILDGKAGASNSGMYSVEVKGDISANTLITVEPQDEMADRDGINFEMSSTGKDNIPTDVEQETTAFTYADGVRPDSAASTTGVVTAYGMTAGIWNGNFEFNVSAAVVEGLQYGTAVQMWDISKTKGVDDVWMTYYQPKATTYSARTTTTEVYEGGTIYITGAGNMEYGVYNYFIRFDKVVEDIVLYAQNECGYNVRYECTATDLNNLILSDGDDATLKIYIDDETAGSSNGTAVDISNYTLDPTNEAFYKFIPTAVVINEGVTNISEWAFFATHITEITLPSTITTIDFAAFGCCTSLESITIPDNVTKIGEGAFAYCDSLTSITWKGTTYTDKAAFNAATGTDAWY